MGSDSVHFAATARVLARAARTAGLMVPGFRSPPLLPGVDRSVRRRAGAPAAVAVRLAGRPHEEVTADMIEGIVVVNGLSGMAADRVRATLELAASAAGDPVAA